MSSSSKRTIYIENVGPMAHRRLAEYLAAGTRCSWKRVEVVLLHGKHRNSNPVCAAVRVPSSISAACWRKNNSTFMGNKLKMSTPDLRQLKSVRWIEHSNGTRVSAVCNRHWSVQDVRPPKPQRGPVSALSENVQTCFYAWDEMLLQGGDRFCYAAVDAGSFLAEPVFENELESVVARALETGVQRLVLKGGSLKKAERARRLAYEYPGIMGFTAGCHPSVSECLGEKKIELLHKLASDPLCVAIGECGLDLTSPNADLKKQTRLLQLQMNLAQQLHKPVLLYERGAKEKLIQILPFRLQLDHPAPVAVHFQEPDKDFIELLIKKGYYIVVTGAWWQVGDNGTTNRELHFWLRTADRWKLDHLLLASNAPFSPPTYITAIVLHEYQRAIRKISLQDFSMAALTWFRRFCLYHNEPCCLPALIELLGHSADVPPKDMAEICLANAKRFFQAPPEPEPEVSMLQTSWIWEQIKFWVPVVGSVFMIYHCLSYVWDLTEAFNSMNI